MPPIRILALILVPALAGCANTASVEVDAPPDGPDQPFLVEGKADGLCVTAGTPAATGLLELVNDATVDVAELDDPVSAGGAGLHRFAAENIVAARPFADLSELDAVPWVGPAACRALAHYACNVARRCEASLSMVTWNVEHFPLTVAAEDALVSVVTELVPDLVGLQEVEDPAAFDRVVARLPGYEGVLGQPGTYNGVAVLVRSGSLDLEAVEDLFVDDWYAFPRPVLSVTVRPHDALDAAALSFAVVHLKAMGDRASQQRRRTGVTRLRAWIDGRRALGDGVTAVVGDFNDELDDPPDDNVFGPLLEPAARAAFLTHEAERAGAVTLVPYGRMIDHVLVTGELLEVLSHDGTDVLALDQTWSSGDFVTTVSDHRPVRSAFRYAVAYP
jgi:endonuclease/exonuclease/phosphatase family metal-dependent hydrolase